MEIKKKPNNNTVNHCIVKKRIVLFGPGVAIFIQQIVLDHIPHFDIDCNNKFRKDI